MIPEQANRAKVKEWVFPTLLLVLFLFLGTWLALLVPFFQGPDEQVHYATIQHWAEPDEKTWPVARSDEYNQSDDIRTYRFSEEIRETAHRMQFDEIKWQPTNTQHFTSHSQYGASETEISKNSWHRYIDVYPPNTSGTWSLYYWLGSGIETFFSSHSIFDRIFFTRLLSVGIGALTVLVAFACARELDWSRTLATLFASLIAFQPMFLATSTVINIDILLVLAFSLFFYGSIRWLSDGIPVSSGLILVSAALIGIFTKGPGIVLLGLFTLLLITSLYQYLHWNWHERLFEGFLILFVIVTLLFIFTPAHILANFLNLGSASIFLSPVESISSYLEKTFTSGAVTWTALTYWGSFGWLDASLPKSILHIILATEVLGIFGLIWLLFDKTPPQFLPNKRVLLFALISILLLQFAIRFFDWRVFDATGKILSGTPGRYFIPNIIPHLLLVVSGLGYFTRTKAAFQRLVLMLSISLFTLISYALWFIILPRYYL